MKHENQQIINLINSVPIVSLKELGLAYHPDFRVDEKVGLFLHISKVLPFANLPFKQGTVITIAEAARLKKRMLILVFVGNRKTGNAVIYVDKKIFDLEQATYRKYSDHIDIIHSLSVSDQNHSTLRGRIGELYSRYKKQVNRIIADHAYDELEEISFIDMLHEFMLTDKLPKLSNTFG